MRFVDYAETKDVALEGVTFKLCHIPTGKFRQLSLLGGLVYAKGTQRALAALKAVGKNEPSEEEVMVAQYNDPQHGLEVEEHQREVVAWGVRGHEGAPFPFIGAKREFLGEQFDGASDVTVARYADDPMLISRLYGEIMDFSRLGDDAKKNS